MVLFQNLPFFQFFYKQYMPGKCVISYSRTKKRLSCKKTRSSESRKIDIFLKGLVHGFGPKLAIFPTFFFFSVKKGLEMCFKIF